tara:strand:+ start:17998 stop:18630 length:633 start_codon:yes stop_codon:yes gene_type:complete
MAHTASDIAGMSLFTIYGERKYMSQNERVRFLSALSVLTDERDRTFCEMMFWTGCRPSEALALTARNIDLDERTVVIRSLKKRRELKGKHFRAVPLPGAFIERLDDVHELRALQSGSDRGVEARLWDFCRTTGWRRLRTVMDTAEITGVRASGRGLRHTYGVHAVITDVPETRIQIWLGHASLKTTAIYLNAVGPEDRIIARRMWNVGAL